MKSIMVMPCGGRYGDDSVGVLGDGAARILRHDGGGNVLGGGEVRIVQGQPQESHRC